ncbi:ABC-2 family transporter protein [Candidatus Falkowbacteria bacterium]|nr:ABC-2 family transporter protein [Candidatus Falkowbacteria bacterium]
MSKYYKVLKQLITLASGSYLSSRLDSVAYFLGKIVRFTFFLIFILSLFKFTETFVGYSKYEAVLFFLTFNLADVLAQALFRGIYMFKNDVKLGNFDFVLSKPINPLFYSFMRLTDILDTIFLIPIVSLIIFTVIKLGVAISFNNVFLYILFLTFSQLIIMGIHVLAASLTIWATEAENFIWLYRESMTVGRFPPEIFPSALQWIFTLIIPVIIIVAFPAKALLGVLNWQWAVFALIYAIGFFAISLLVWKISLKHYSSASS